MADPFARDVVMCATAQAGSIASDFRTGLSPSKRSLRLSASHVDPNVITTDDSERLERKDPRGSSFVVRLLALVLPATLHDWRGYCLFRFLLRHQRGCWQLVARTIVS